MVERSTLPRPVLDDANETSPVIDMGEHEFLFPLPLRRMPYEVSTCGVDFPMAVQEPTDIAHQEVSLPVYARIEVFPHTSNTECILIATRNRRRSGRGGDGLTVYSAVHRTDFTFRLNVFEGFPDVHRHAEAKLLLQEWNELGLVIGEHRATYWINGQRIATCVFKEGVLPGTKLFIGAVSYATPYRIRRFDLSMDPQVLTFLTERILTLTPTWQMDGKLSVACTSMSGELVATMEAGAATRLIPGTYVTATSEFTALAAHWYNDRWYVLPNRDAADSDSEETDEDEDDDLARGALWINLAPGCSGRVQHRFEDESLCVKFTDHEHVALVRPRDVVALRVNDDVEERLVDFRSRLTSQLQLFECDVKLVLANGAYLGTKEESTPLSVIFTS